MSGKSSIDHELERLLAGEETALSALYGKLPAAEPDEKLDAAVLAMAHRAVNPHLAAVPRADRRAPARPRPWMFALGSAAGLVLAAGVAWQLRSTIQQNGDETLQRASAPASEGVIAVTPMERAARPDTNAPAPAAAPASAPVAQPALAASKPQATPQQTGAALGDDARAKLDLEKSKKRADEEPADEFADKERQNAARREEHGVTEYTLPAGAAGPAPRPAPFPAAAAPAKQAEAVAAPAEDAKREQESRSGGKLDTLTVSGSRSRSMDVDGAPAPSREQDAVERKAAIATGGNHAEPAPPAPQAKDAVAAKALKSAPASAAPSHSTVLQNNARLYPEAWIGVMRQLLRDGRREEARENLDLFRRKYPDYKLPADLQAIVETP